MAAERVQRSSTRLLNVQGHELRSKIEVPELAMPEGGEG